jgi:hypothetical protein
MGQMGNPATLENEAPTKILGQKTFLSWVLVSFDTNATFNYNRFLILKSMGMGNEQPGRSRRPGVAGTVDCRKIGQG